MPESPTAVKRACDSCHRRKIKCITEIPGQCNNCRQADLKCTYHAVPQKKGPKGSRAKVLSELRESQRQQGILLKRPRSSEGSPQTESSNSFSSLLSDELISACVEFFFSHVYPTQPILTRQRLRDNIADAPSSLEASCLVTALCAYMLIQPNMQPPSEILPNEYKGDASSTLQLGTTLLMEAAELRKKYNYIESLSLECIATSFFLFGCYFCLEKHSLAYFHLRESSTLALISGMQHEETYNDMDETEGMLKRRLFWLLFVTERAYAIQTQRPLSLHATINLPNVNNDPAEAVELIGFNHLIVLFRPFDDTFVGLWNEARGGATSDWIALLQKQLTDALPRYLRSTETQAVDLKTSQQWLRIMIWQLSISHKLLSSSATNEAMTFRYPLELSMKLAAEASRFSQQAMEVHGIGLIKKLFDVAWTLIDVMTCVPIESQTFEVGPREHLNQFLHLMSKLRGGNDRYLPLLLDKANNALPGSIPASLHAPTTDELVSAIEASDSLLRADIDSSMAEASDSVISVADFSDLLNTPGSGLTSPRSRSP